jgi:hypothetical protein
MPIRGALQGQAFSAEEISSLSSVFEECLTALRLVDRNDPVVSLVAARIVELARPGKIEAAALRDAVLRSFADDHRE